MEHEVVGMMTELCDLMKRHHLNDMEIRLLEGHIKRTVEIVRNLETMLRESRNEKQG